MEGTELKAVFGDPLERRMPRVDTGNSEAAAGPGSEKTNGSVKINVLPA
jgi:hypothetical protein